MAGKIKHYVKSALRQAKADPLFTAIYIAGVTLAIATTLTMAIIYNIKLSPIYPEVNRGNTYFITQLIGENGEAYPRYGQMSYTFAKELRDIEGVNAVGVNGGLGESTITFGEGKPNVKMSSRSVDDGFFKIYEFKFLDGFPFSEEDITGQVKDVIITDEAAKKLFGTTEEIVGKIIPINYSEYRVKGVVESGSRFGNQSYSQLYFPARVAEKEESGTVADRLFGWYVTEILIEDGSIDSVNEQIINTLRKQADGSGWTFRLQSSRPVSYMQQMLKPYMENFSWWEIIKEKLLLVMVILIVPAVNLSGLISGRMDSRVAEVGLRKAFGANDRDVINM
ncbi:MAG: ABC transporter permease, partial [Muribaculaceae bacterium]|nr:ABC transporter permease [Muribaculaceae bacterium]